MIKSHAKLQINLAQKYLDFIYVSQKLDGIQTRFESQMLQMLRIFNNMFSETKILKGKRAQEMMRVYHKR